MRFHPVARASEIPPGAGIQTVVDGRAVALFNVDGTFHAIDGVCLHRGGPVGEGDLEGTIVTCPWHGFQYDVTTGKLTLDPEIGLAKHTARVEDDTVFVALVGDGA